MSFSLQDGVNLCRLIEPTLSSLGYHCALHGSTLYKGESEKDIDVIVYPHNVKVTKPHGEIFTALREKCGISPAYESPASNTDKEVWPCSIEGHRIDMFFLA